MPRYVRSLDADGRQRAFAHTFEAWSEGREQSEHVAYQEEQLERGAGLLDYAGLVDDDGKLLASMKRFSLALRHRGEVIPTMGIGALMVPTALRRRGLARELIEASIDDARSSGSRAAWLFSEVDPAYYARLGFVEVPFRLAASDVDSLPDAIPTGFSVSCGAKSSEGSDRVFGGSDGDGDGAAFLDEARFVSLADALHPARTSAARAYFAWRNNHTYVSLWSATGALRGYVAVGSMSSGAQPALEVCEWASTKPDEAALLAALRSVAVSWGATRVVGSLKALLDGAGAACATGPSLEVTNERYGVPMFRSLDPSLTLDPEKVHVAIADYF